MSAMQLTLARYKDGSDPDFLAIIPDQLLEDQFLNFLLFYIDTENDREGVTKRIQEGRKIPGNVAVIKNFYVHALKSRTCLLFTEKKLLEEVTSDDLVGYYKSSFGTKCLREPIRDNWFYAVRYFIHDSLIISKTNIDIIAAVFKFAARFLADFYEYKENESYKEDGVELHEMYHKINTFSHVVHHSVSDMVKNRRMWIDGYFAYEKNPSVDLRRGIASLEPTDLLEIQGIHEILFQMHKLVIHDPRITTRPKMFPNGCESLFTLAKCEDELLKAENELAKRNLTYETAIEIMDRISSQSWDGIMASNYCIPYLHEYPYIIIDLYLEKFNRGKSYYHRQLMFNLCHLVWLNYPLQDLNNYLYKKVVVTLPKFSEAIPPLATLPCVEIFIHHLARWDYNVTRQHFIHILSNHCQGVCHRIIEFLRCDPENVKIFVDIMEKGEKEQAIYHSGLCWTIIINIVRWCPDIIPADYWEKIHAVLLQSLNSMMNIGQIKTSIIMYEEFLNKNSSFYTTLQDRLASRIEAEALFDKYIEKGNSGNYLQEEDLRNYLEEFYYVFFLRVAEKHAFYSTKLILKERLEKFFAKTEEQFNNLFVCLTEMLHYHPLLRETMFLIKDFKQIFRNILERGGDIVLSEKAIKLTTIPIPFHFQFSKLFECTWPEFHATEFVGKPLLGQFNMEGLGKQISKGGQASVYIMDAPTLFNETIAKIFDSYNAYDEISGELELLMTTQSHPHVVHIYGYILTDNDYVGIMMEYCRGGTVGNVIKNKEVVYDEVTILKWSAEAASGLTFLHANGITHRDVKPDNMLLTEEGIVKIADLGISKWKAVPKTKMIGDVPFTNTSRHGTEGYRAPEIDVEDDRPYKNIVDVYSLGQSILHMITRIHPCFYVKGTSNGESVIVSEALIKLYNRMVSCDDDRPSMKVVFEELQSQRGVTLLRIDRQITDFDFSDLIITA